MSTPFPKAGEVKPKWILIDLEGKILGRAATRVASILKGKHKATYTTHCDTGDHVVVINAAKVRLTGKKLDQKLDFRHSGWPGGDTHTPYRTMMEKNPEKVFELAVKGMLPKNPLGRKMIKKMIVYKGSEHHQQAQQPVPLEI
ncbi:MAG: 50S ribosomal protein L13 [Candidatus Firestonebacteria bacterium]|nr:50S ribosomal protein L13 [Candidatus Firestonebacteria bacterium]